MADVNIDGVVTWLKNWFYDKTEITQELNAKVNVAQGSGNADKVLITDSGGSVTTGAKNGHSHGSVTSDGKIGSTANLPVITGTGGALTVGSFGNSANTFCQGNDSRLSDARTPTAHNQASTTITESSALANIGTSANATQHTINDAINTKIGELVNIDFVTVVTTLPTASASTMGKIYLVAITGSSDNNYAEYITVRSGTSPNYTYAWEKFGEISGSGLSVDWSDITSKPSTYPPSSHTHGEISNDGKITTSVTIDGNDSILISDDSDSNKIKTVSQILTTQMIDANAYANIGTSADEKQVNINDGINTALGNKGAKTDDVDWTYSSNGFTNGVKLVSKSDNANGRITLHLKS